MEKKYENSNLKKYFETYIDKMEVEDEYKPVLTDILLRRAYQYKFTKEEIQTDMRTLLGSLKSIEIKKMPKGYENAAGLYSPLEKKITIAKDYSKSSSPEDLYQTLTHEVYHALTHEPNGYDRLGGINSITGAGNTSLLEAIIEKASYRTVKSNQRDNLYYNKNARGYNDMTFIIDLLESTYGVSEQALLRNSIQGRERLVEFLSSIGNETPNDSRIFLDSLEANYALLHKTLYPFNEETKLSNKEKAANIKDAITGISNVCESKFRDLLISKPVENIKDAKELVEESQFNHNKMSVIIQERAKHFATFFGDNTINMDINNRVAQSVRTTIDIIDDMNSVLQNSNNFSSKEEALRIHNWARNGNLYNYGKEDLKKLGIEIDRSKKEKSFQLSKEVLDRESEDDPFFEEWDNTEIANYFKKVAISKTQSPLTKAWHKGIDKIKGLFNKKDSTKLLSEHNEINNSEKNEASNIFTPPSEEEQKKYNEQVKDAVKKHSQSMEENNKNLDEDNKEII